eukprot:14933-Chlamydomonas_euryale.AAC.1
MATKHAAARTSGQSRRKGRGVQSWAAQSKSAHPRCRWYEHLVGVVGEPKQILYNPSGRWRLGRDPSSGKRPRVKPTDCRPGRPAAKSRSQWMPSA